MRKAERTSNMADSRTLTLTFSLDNGDNYNINVPEPKEDLTKSETDAAMQTIIDTRTIVKDGHYASYIKEAYITTTTKTVME